MTDSADANVGVFQDLTVVDVSGSVATSYASKLFADYGALVINVEPRDGFDTRRLKPLLPSGDSAMHGYLHANKHSVLASCKQFHEEPLAHRADLVIFDPDRLPNGHYLLNIDTIGNNFWEHWCLKSACCRNDVACPISTLRGFNVKIALVKIARNPYYLNTTVNRC